MEGQAKGRRLRSYRSTLLPGAPTCETPQIVFSTWDMLLPDTIRNHHINLCSSLELELRCSPFPDNSPWISFLPLFQRHSNCRHHLLPLLCFQRCTEGCELAVREGCVPRHSLWLIDCCLLPVFLQISLLCAFLCPNFPLLQGHHSYWPSLLHDYHCKEPTSK